jgi:hypothetical protein
VGVEPGNEVGGLGVDTRIARLSTAIAPGHNTRQLVATHEGTSGVTLAGVLAASVIPSTDHGVSDVTLAIGLAAVSIRHNRDIHLQKNKCKKEPSSWLRYIKFSLEYFKNSATIKYY